MTDHKKNHGRIVVDYHPQKEEPYRRCLTVGGNLINYPGDIGNPTSDMIASKLIFNSVLSTPYAKFMGFVLEISILGNLETG